MLTLQTNGKTFLFDKVLHKKNPNFKTNQGPVVHITTSTDQEKDF